MNFYERVYRLARKIPRGRVMTYGQIAALISTPRAARVVGFAMRALPENTDVPWPRVINSQGRISIVNWRWRPKDQARFLRAEGIKVQKRNDGFWIDLDKYLWVPKNRADRAGIV
ncbi:methylated-DNA--[protein]-cysteine S-methyltransferase [Candidatus Parcubacteria bacterium]|nr:methylated-DNA--[protein]-cysteine S-methyltransferase [Candidatus Parcubacteria bacterium]